MFANTGFQFFYKDEHPRAEISAQGNIHHYYSKFDQCRTLLKISENTQTKKCQYEDIPNFNFEKK